MTKATKRIGVAFLVLAGLGAAGLMCTRVGERGRYAARYSTYGAGPEGTQGVFELARVMGEEPERWIEDLGRLPANAMLFALGDCRHEMARPVGRIERENLVEWVEGGGVLVVAGAVGYLEHEDFGVSLAASGADEGCPEVATEDETSEDTDLDANTIFREVIARRRLPDPEPRTLFGSHWPFLDLPATGMRRPVAIRVNDDVQSEVLLRLDDANGRPVGVRVSRGEGTVIVLASGAPFQNRELGAERGGLLFARLLEAQAPTGPVLFDEYHLGVGARRSLVRYLRQLGSGALVIQLLVLAAILLFRVSARFGMPVRAAPEAPAGTASYVEGVGALYEKARDPGAAGAIMVRRALREIQRHYHHPSPDPEHLAVRLEQRGAEDAASAVRELALLVTGEERLAPFTARLDALVVRAVADPGPHVT